MPVKKPRVIWCVCDKKTGDLTSNIIASTDAQRISLCVFGTEKIVKFTEVVEKRG